MTCLMQQFQEIHFKICLDIKIDLELKVKEERFLVDQTLKEV